tara:strand:- start:5648 stop:5839 length:192 start_codon:yes stop_codon:yes gene_type:complete
MTSKNDITGDSIRTKVKGGDSKKYADNWEKIFGKDKGLTRREKVLLDPLEASQRSDSNNKSKK